jgi:hypothetical protein
VAGWKGKASFPQSFNYSYFPRDFFRGSIGEGAGIFQKFTCIPVEVA